MFKSPLNSCQSKSIKKLVLILLFINRILQHLMKLATHHIFLFILLLIKSSNTFSQSINENNFHHRGGLGVNALNVSGAGILSIGNTGTGANININYHRCNWKADPNDATKTIKGDVTTYFKTISSNVSSINFDFNNASFNNDSLKAFYHGTACNIYFNTSGNQDVLNIDLPNPLINIGTIDSITINYKGSPPAANGDALGYQIGQDGAANNYIYTLSESYEDKDWWPCKADMQDKIDSLDINVTVPKVFWVAANGVMTDSAISGSNRTFKFKHRYPIASYLVAICIAKFKRYNLGNLSVGSNKLPFIINLFPDKSTPVETNIFNILNNHKLVFAAFNNFYGDYPYSKEKHGFYEFGFSGGMEHQTFSGIGGGNFQSNSTLAHELGHQWWGDKVSFATWNELWLAEGFATYSEVLMAEFVPSIGVSYLNKLANNKASARFNNYTPIYISNIDNSNTIWTSGNTSAVYERGCMVVSMLRSLMGDNKFFTACKNYLSDTTIAYKAATTADLQRNMQNQFGENMTNFFGEWIYKKGTPNYAVLWGNDVKKINIKLVQNVIATGSGGTAATFFPMPIIIKIEDTILGKDTTVVMYHKTPNSIMYAGNGLGLLVNGNIISYNLSFIPNKISFDPENKTMANASSIARSVALPILDIELFAQKTSNNNSIKCNVVTNNKIVKVILQKSIDGINFVDEGSMELGSTKGFNFQFQFSDFHITARNNFYRAVVYTQIETVYSKIISVENTTVKNIISLLPNPAKNFVEIRFSNNYNLISTFKVIDAFGKIYSTTSTKNNYLQLNLSGFANGTYFVEMYQQNKLIATEKLVVVK